MLDLGHHPLVRLVGQVRRLGDEPVEPGSLELLEPPLGHGLVVGHRRQVDRRRRVGERRLEPPTPLGERPRREVIVVLGEQVEDDEAGRRLLGQQPDPAGRGVQAQLQRLEVQGAALRVDEHDLAVDDAALGQVRADRLDDLGEVPRHRPLVAAADLDLVAVPEDDRTEPVPLRLVELPRRYAGADLGQHRLDRRHHGKVHTAILLACPTPAVSAGERSRRRRRRSPAPASCRRCPGARRRRWWSARSPSCTARRWWTPS